MLLYYKMIAKCWVTKALFLCVYDKKQKSEVCEELKELISSQNKIYSCKKT